MGGLCSGKSDNTYIEASIKNQNASVGVAPKSDYTMRRKTSFETMQESNNNNNGLQIEEVKTKKVKVEKAFNAQ